MNLQKRTTIFNNKMNQEIVRCLRQLAIFCYGLSFTLATCAGEFREKFAFPVWEATRGGQTLTIVGEIHRFNGFEKSIPKELHVRIAKADRVAVELNSEHKDGNLIFGKPPRNGWPKSIIDLLQNEFSNIRSTSWNVFTPESLEKLPPVLAVDYVFSFAQVKHAFGRSAPILLPIEDGFSVFLRRHYGSKGVLSLESVRSRGELWDACDTDKINIALLEKAANAWESNRFHNLSSVLIPRAMLSYDPVAVVNLMVEFHGLSEAAKLIHNCFGRSRNEAWVANIERMTMGSLSVALSVGIMYLVGKDNLLDLLKNRGFQVKQIH